MKTMQDNITELRLPTGARIFIAPTSAKDVVTIQGSVLGGPHHLKGGKKVVARLCAELLDAGTKIRDKYLLRNLLAVRGATLSFASSGDRTFFSASCLPEDVKLVVTIIAECLSQSLFEAKELELAKERMRGALMESKNDTYVQAGIGFSRLLYENTHANYALTTDEAIKACKKVARDDITSFASFGQQGMILSLVGDLEVKKIKKDVLHALKTISPIGHTVSKKAPHTKKHLLTDSFITIPDKKTIDTFFGAVLSIRTSDPAYLPLTILISMLGGGGLSSGHLMRTIRERDGLTYGIKATPTGFSVDTEGIFQIWATFSPETFRKAVLATRKEILTFFTRGITEKALTNKQTELSGSYLVGLGSTLGLARVLHKIGMDGKPLSYIDEYPKLVQKITLREINEVAQLIPKTTFSVVACGTIA